MFYCQSNNASILLKISVNLIFLSNDIYKKYYSKLFSLFTIKSFWSDLDNSGEDFTSYFNDDSIF